METKAWLIKDFPVELQKQIKIHAIEKGVRMKDIVIEALEQYLKKVR